MATLFFATSLALVLYSLVRPEKGLQIVLSIAGGLLLGYQVSCIILFRKALLTSPKRIHMKMYRGYHSNWWWAFFMFFLVTTVISILIALDVGCIDALKVTLLSSFLAQYLGLFIEYFWPFMTGEILGHFARNLHFWSIGFCCLACVGALISLARYAIGEFGFVICLWVSKIERSHGGEFSLICCPD